MQYTTKANKFLSREEMKQESLRCLLLYNERHGIANKISGNVVLTPAR